MVRFSAPARIAALLSLGLSGCVETAAVFPTPAGEAGVEAPPPDPISLAPPNTSARALAALPAGIPPGFLIRDDLGCYGIALVSGNPPSGIPLRDAAGVQICDA